MKRTKAQKGITLIALTITIIILIILAVVTIGVVLNTGIIDLSKKSKDDYNEKKAEEESLLDVYQGILDFESMHTVTDAQIKGVLSKTKVTCVKDAYGNIISLPAGFKITKDGNTVPEGIVIEDCTDSATKGSQFVWIPVGNVKKEDGTNSEIKLGRYYFDSEGKVTTSSVTDQTDSKFYAGEALKDATTTYAHAKDIKEYVSSTNKWGGYYLARYEARSKKERTYSNKTLTQLTTRGKDNMYYFVTQKQASMLSQGMYNEESGTNVISDLANRFAWDTAIVYIQEMGNEKYSRQYSKNTSLAKKGTNNLTDTKQQDKVCNIWDMSSNCVEWTTYNGDCVGGIWHSRYTSQYWSDSISSSGDSWTFRPILYIDLNATVNTDPVDNKEPEEEYVPEITVKMAQEKGVLSTTESTDIIDEYGNIIKVPAGFKVTKDGNTVPEGIVIEDCTTAATKGSQFVWIPVGTVYKNADKAKTKIDLARYSFNTDGTVDTKFTYIEQFKTPNIDGSANYYYTEGKKNDTTANVHAIDIEDFVNSTKTNGGYYIGRYEARTTTLRSRWGTPSSELTQVTTKGSDYIYRNISQSQAATLSRGMYKTNKETNATSDLMNGFAWDTAVAFIQEIGNDAYSVKTSKNTTLAEKGTNNLEDITQQDKVCNIWDISSNYLEWSTEWCSGSGSPCVMRGGYFDNTSRYTMCRHPYYNKTENDTCSWCVFRPILYISSSGKASSWTQNGTTITNGKQTLQIGDKVEYDELSNGSFSHSVYASQSGVSSSTNIGTQTISTQNLQWRVLGVNGKGQIELFSTYPANELSLGGEKGWLNSVSILNTSCNKLYGKGDLAESARCLSLDDIDKLAGITTEADKKSLDSRYGRWYRYKYDTASGKIQYATSDDYNPDTGEGNWSSFKSTGTTKFKEPGKTAISSANPNGIVELKCTEYNYKISSRITYKTSDGVLLSNLLRSSSKWQWLATAYTRNTDTGMDFSVRRIGKGEDSITFYNCLWSSDGQTTANYGGNFRPVVTLKMEAELVYSNGTYYVR